MALKTSVKIGNITNLSEARYCSGMGVAFLGVRTIPSDHHYLDAKVFSEIRQWISGPEIVAEIYGLQNQNSIDQIINDYQPALLELSLSEFHLLPQLSIPCLLNISAAEFQTEKAYLLNRVEDIRYVVLPSETDSKIISEIANSFKVMLLVNQPFNLNILDLPIAGLLLAGTDEEQPGFKNYDSIAGILESLEAD